MAKGFIAIDDSLINTSADNNWPIVPFVKDYAVTVSKATNRTHNGTFGESDQSGISLNFSGGGAADLARELVGQPAVTNISVCSNSLAPGCPNTAFSMQTGGASDGNPASGDVMTLMSCRPMVQTGARVYRCTLWLTGSYKYCDRDALGTGSPRWVCKKWSGKATYYMTIDLLAGRVGFTWFDARNKVLDQVYGCLLPEIEYAQWRPPTASLPAGTWEASLPLWSHVEGIDIDGGNGDDATRSRVSCLSGVESLMTFSFIQEGGTARVSVRDFAVGSFSGNFSQMTCYDTVHYAFSDPIRDKVLRWPAPFSGPGGQILPGGGIACVNGTVSCRLDTKLTAEALKLELGVRGPGNHAAEVAVGSYLADTLGYRLELGSNKGGAALTLQPEGNENLELLIP